MLDVILPIEVIDMVSEGIRFGEHVNGNDVITWSEDSDKMIRFEFNPECRKMPNFRTVAPHCYQVTFTGISKAAQQIIREVMGCTFMASDDYKMRKTVVVFLQGESDGWTLLEFDHQPDAVPFMKYLAKQLSDPNRIKMASDYLQLLKED